MEIRSRSVSQALLKSLTLVIVILVLAACGSSVSPEVANNSEGIDLNAIDYSEGMTINYAAGMANGMPNGLTTQAHQLLANAGFDTNTDWFNCGPAANSNISKGVLTLSGNDACVYQTIAATPNTTYSLSCDGYSSAEYTSATLSMLNSSWHVIDSSSVYIGGSTSVDSTSNTTYVAVTLYANGPTTVEGCVLTAGGEPPHPPGGGDDLLANPGFDTNTDWFNCGPAVNSNISKGVLTLSGDNACVYQTIAASADKTYTLSCDGSSSAEYTSATLSMLDANWNAIDTSSAHIGGSTSLASTSGATYVGVTLYANGPTTVEGCSLEADDNPPPPPGGGDDELLANPGFDTNTDWFNCGPAVNSNISNGRLTLSGHSACVYQTVPATPNTTYSLVCDSASSADYSTVTVSVLNSHWNAIDSSTVLVDDQTAQPSVMTDIYAGSNAAYVAVTFYSEGPAIHESCSLTAK